MLGSPDRRAPVVAILPRLASRKPRAASREPRDCLAPDPPVHPTSLPLAAGRRAPPILLAASGYWTNASPAPDRPLGPRPAAPCRCMPRMPRATGGTRPCAHGCPTRTLTCAEAARRTVCRNGSSRHAGLSQTRSRTSYSRPYLVHCTSPITLLIAHCLPWYRSLSVGGVRGRDPATPATPATPRILISTPRNWAPAQPGSRAAHCATAVRGASLDSARPSAGASAGTARRPIPAHHRAPPPARNDAAAASHCSPAPFSLPSLPSVPSISA